MEAPTFEEEEVVTVKEQTNGDISVADNGEGRKKKREKRESTIALEEKEEEGTNKLIKNWENGGGQSSSSPQRQVEIGLRLDSKLLSGGRQGEVAHIENVCLR